MIHFYHEAVAQYPDGDTQEGKSGIRHNALGQQGSATPTARFPQSVLPHLYSAAVGICISSKFQTDFLFAFRMYILQYSYFYIESGNENVESRPS